MNSDLGHLGYEQLADLIEGRLGADEAAALRRHLQGCPHCSADLSWIEQTVGLMRSDSSEDAPPEAITRAIGLFRPVVPQGFSVRRLLAVLSFDSATLTPQFGLRSAAGAARQVIYSAADYEIDVRVTPQGPLWRVAGQLLGPPASGTVDLVAGSGRQSAAIDEGGEFGFTPMAAGNYELIIRLADAEIAISGLVLGG